MFSLLMEWMGAEEKMVGLKKYQMWWGGERGAGVAKNILHNVGKIVL